jgi:hypothetical protein
MINEWTKFGVPMLYGKGETDLIMKTSVEHEIEVKVR